MGMFDTFGTLEIQLKVGPCLLMHFDVGSEVPIPDGVYLDYDGVVVVKDGIFVAEFEHVTTKWGDVLENGAVLSHRSPVVQAIARTLGELGHSALEENE